jgi:cytochrome oxidase Cu insertion factor (SCO1/SenC/PrrC family)
MQRPLGHGGVLGRKERKPNISKTRKIILKEKPETRNKIFKQFEIYYKNLEKNIDIDLKSSNIINSKSDNIINIANLLSIEIKNMGDTDDFL